MTPSPDGGAGDVPRVAAAARSVAGGSVAELLAAARAQLDGVPVPLEERWVDPEPELLDRLAAARAPVVLAGPGVVHAGAVGGLHALAAAGSLGVLNTWGAKGIFHWRSRHHLATAGLQARDFELGGIGDADLVLATGVDDAETPPGWRHGAAVVDVAPGALSPLAERWARPLADIPMPPLREGLAAVTQDGWAAEGRPPAPSRVTRSYAEVLGPAGLMAADPGEAGFWVARTFPTTALGSVVVPGAVRDGLAVACAVLARLRDPARPVLVAVDAPLSAASRAMLDAGEALGAAVTVEVWDPDGERLDPQAHRTRLERVLGDGGGPSSTEVVSLAVDGRQMARMVEVAGPRTAWRP